MQNEINTYVLDLEKHKVKILQPSITIVDKRIQLKYIACTCRGSRQAAAKLILPKPNQPVVVYNNCAKTLMAAFSRQIRKVPPHQQQEMERYHKWCDAHFEQNILPILAKFEYNFGDWFNHLTTYNKQREIVDYITQDTIDKDSYDLIKANFKNINSTRTKKLQYLTYELFCKREKQIIEDKMPKNRAISACPPNVKFVMGPVIWQLEKMFKQQYHGYGQHDRVNNRQANNWEEVAELYERRYRDGLIYTGDADGSAWDTTQTTEMRYLVNKVYKWLAQNGKIHHVDPTVFEYVATAKHRKLVAYLYNPGKVIYAEATVDQTVFSGNPDTTFGNTLTMASVNHYTLQTAGYYPHEYEIDNKGDDCAQYLSSIKPGLGEHYNKIWTGLGLMLKYHNIGSYHDITFCSTNVIPYKKNNAQKFRIVRQVNRMNPLSHYSQKALSYTPAELKQYLTDQAIAMQNWANGLPFYSTYINTYKIAAESIKCNKPTLPKIGKKKITLPNYLKSDRRYDHYIHYGRDYAEAIVTRTDNREPPDAKYVYKFLLEKYNMSQYDIRQNEIWMYTEKSYDRNDYIPRTKPPLVDTTQQDC